MSDITSAVERAKEKARNIVDDLGMGKLLRSKEKVPIPQVCEQDVIGEEDDNGDDECVGVITSELLQECTNMQDEADISTSVSTLSSAGIIDKDLSAHLINLQQLSQSNSPPEQFFKSESAQAPQGKQKKHCPYVEIKYNRKVYCINKTTAVWLFSEGERVSSDRLFRVRTQQPYSSSITSNLSPKAVSGSPVCVSEQVNVGDLCVFVECTKEWTISKVLQFCFYKEKTQKMQQYRASHIKVSEAQGIGVLCSWYMPLSEPMSYTLAQDSLHSYVPS